MLYTPTNTDIMKAFCPQCNKEVNVIYFDYSVNKYLHPEDKVKTTLKMVGCIECNTLFYKRDE